MSDQNKRALPRERIASGTNAAVPDNKSRDWMMSLKAVNPKDRGRNEAARIAATIKAATAANHTLELLLKKNTPARSYSRWLERLQPGYCSNLVGVES